MIKLSNGHCLEYVAAAGVLGFDGRGYPWEYPLRWFKLLDTSLLTVITKTLFLEKHKGNFRWYAPFDVVKFITADGETINPFLALIYPRCVDGILNAVDLTGPGFETWLKEHYLVIQHSNNKVIVSITGEEKDCLMMVKRLQGLKNIVGIEYDSSCPSNIENPEKIIRVCSVIRENSELPLLLKLGYSQPYVAIAKELEGKVEAISLNSVPWQALFPDKESPLAEYGGGGFSGLLAQPFIWKMMFELMQATTIPVIGASIWNYEDLVYLQKYGVLAVHFGAIFMLFPWRSTKYIKRRLREQK